MDLLRFELGQQSNQLEGSCEKYDALRRGSECVISACASNGDLDGALTLFHKMRARGMRLDDSTLHPFFCPACPTSEGTSGESGEQRGKGNHSPQYLASDSGGLGSRTRSIPRVWGDYDRDGRLQAKAGGWWRRQGKRRRATSLLRVDLSSAYGRSGQLGQDCAEVEESQWKNLPQELLVRITQEMNDSRTVVSAAGVCSSWRDALGECVTELSLTWCGAHVSRVLQSIAHKFRRLQVVSLRRCGAADDVAVMALAESCSDLRALDLSSCVLITDVSLNALAKGCKLIEILDASGCMKITEAAVVSLANSCEGLKMLNLCGCSGAGTDIALQALGHSCHELQSLNVGWCERITDIGVLAVALGCPSMRVLDLCGCLYITDKSVVTIASVCPELHSLGLHCCRLITDASILALVASRSQSEAKRITPGDSRAPGLRPNHIISRVSSSLLTARVSLSQWTVTGSLPAVSQGPSGKAVGLTSLNLSGCIALRSAAVQALCNAFPSLHTCPSRRSLNISGCVNLTNVQCRCMGGNVFQDQRDMMAASINPENRPL